ncbi:MAG: hypothetical protein AAGN66_28510 [Acidobacteriota bacterium]
MDILDIAPPTSDGDGPWRNLLDSVPIPVSEDSSPRVQRTPSEELRLSRPARTGEFQRLLAVVATIFFLTTLGLSAWVYNLERPASPEPGGRLNVKMYDIPPGTAVPSAPSIPVGEEKVLIMRSGERRIFARYRLELEEMAKGIAMSFEAERKPQGGVFTLVLEDGVLPAGVYRATLLGLTGQSSEEVGRYAFIVDQ